MNVSKKKIQRIFQAYEPVLSNSKQPLKNLKAIDAISHWRTPEMGVSYFGCEDGHSVLEQHHSCRHRICYQCSIEGQQKWIESQHTRLLNVPHFHVIFTLSHDYLNLWRWNK